MAISYNAGTNTLTLDGVNTYTLLDIYNADVAGAWGVVTRVGEMYLFMCNIVIGDAGGNATRLIDSNVGFQIGVTGTRKTFQTLAGSSFEMTGCILIFWLLSRKTSYGTWKFENCSIYERESAAISLYMRGDQDHKRSEFDVGRWYNRDGTCSYKDCYVKLLLYFYYYTSGNIDGLVVENIMNVYVTSPTIKNTEIKGVLYIKETGIHVTTINSSWSGLSFNYANNYLLEEWEFNVLVTDKDNNPLSDALVTLKDKNGVVKHFTLTGADGKLPTTWEVLANRYDGTSETKTEYNPFTLTVTKEGYADYETEITIDHIVKDDQIVLGGLTYGYDDVMDGLTDIKGTGHIKDTHSLVDIKDSCVRKRGTLEI
jgi:hypothetical protein